MYELRRLECYTKLKNLVQDGDLSECSLPINKIKEFRHNKTKSRQKDKFERLISKSNGGYFHNYSTFDRHMFLANTPKTPAHNATLVPKQLHP